MTSTQETSHEALVSMLRHDLEIRADWDEPPAISFIYETDGIWSISELNLPSSAWQPHPAAGLHYMAESLKEAEVSPLLILASAVRPENWRGAAFFSESWMVEQKKENPGDDPDPVFLAMARARMISQHPARVEVKVWHAALADGTFIIVAARRDGDFDHAVMQPGDKTIEGTIPEALSEIVKALAR